MKVGKGKSAVIYLFSYFSVKSLHCNSSDLNLNPFPFEIIDVFGFFGTLWARATRSEQNSQNSRVVVKVIGVCLGPMTS